MQNKFNAHVPPTYTKYAPLHKNQVLCVQSVRTFLVTKFASRIPYADPHIRVKVYFGVNCASSLTSSADGCEEISMVFKLLNRCSCNNAHSQAGVAVWDPNSSFRSTSQKEIFMRRVNVSPCCFFPLPCKTSKRCITKQTYRQVEPSSEGTTTTPYLKRFIMFGVNVSS